MNRFIASMAETLNGFCFLVIVVGGCLAGFAWGSVTYLGGWDMRLVGTLLFGGAAVISRSVAVWPHRHPWFHS